MKKLMLYLFLLLLLGCGGEEPGLRTDTSLPPLKVVFNPESRDLEFAAEISSTSQFSGMVMESFLTFDWKVSHWKESDSLRTAKVRFSKVKAMQRSGAATGYEPIKAFSRLEGFSAIYSFDDDKGMEILNKPNKDPEFMQGFSQLQMGLVPMVALPLEEALPYGEAVELPIKARDMLPEDSAKMADKVQMTVTWTGMQDFRGHPCARLKFKGFIELDEQAKSGEVSSQTRGKIRISGEGLYSREHRFFLRSQTKLDINLSMQDFDARGKALGGEKSMEQSVTAASSLKKL